MLRMFVTHIPPLPDLQFFILCVCFFITSVPVKGKTHILRIRGNSNSKVDREFFLHTRCCEAGVRLGPGYISPPLDAMFQCYIQPRDQPNPLPW